MMSDKLKTLAVIPARMGATRFPDKPLKEILGMPMVGHVYHRAKLAQNVTNCVVATCDQKISDYIESIGGTAVMTSAKHERATDRSAECVELLEKTGQNYDLILMVQGDEPLLVPSMLDDMIQKFSVEMNVLNLMAAITTESEFVDPNEVKVVCDRAGNALYFSRKDVPSRCKWPGDVPRMKQLGIIAFRRDILKQFTDLAQTELEKIESVDMLRLLENGISIRMLQTPFRTVGVDTPEELRRAEALMLNDNVRGLYQI